jgi:hypothetical protein
MRFRQGDRKRLTNELSASWQRGDVTSLQTCTVKMRCCYAMLLVTLKISAENGMGNATTASLIN